jgi:hypothetical protein
MDENTTAGSRSASMRAQVFFVLALVIGCALGCGGTNVRWSAKESAVRAPANVPPILMLADLQYSVPMTDYDIELPGRTLHPSDLSERAHSFYRHSAATLVLPLVLDSILSEAESSGIRVGVIAGDLVEFACADELRALLDVLERHPRLPMIITPGNHDVMFHGSFQTDTRNLKPRLLEDEEEEAAAEPSDDEKKTAKRSLLFDYAWTRKWRRVCSSHGGVLTKSDFVQQVLTYYQKVWGFELDVPQACRDTPADPRATGSFAGAAWSKDRRTYFEYSAKIANIAENQFRGAHRRSHLYQRFTIREAGTEPLALTILDTTDYAEKPAICDRVGGLVQVGAGGSISTKQIDWLSKIRPAATQQVFVSHYMPLSNTGMGLCDETTFTHSEAWDEYLKKLSSDSLFVYGHVHRPFRSETWTSKDGIPDLHAVQLPSLIDNHAYVQLKSTGFHLTQLDKPKQFASAAPFSQPGSTCEQRYREYAELQRNLACFAGDAAAVDVNGRCDSLAGEFKRRQGEQKSICQGNARAWQASNAPLWEELQKSYCPRPPAGEHWRCVLRGLGSRAIASLGKDPDPTGEGARAIALFARSQLAATKTLRGMN